MVTVATAPPNQVPLYLPHAKQRRALDLLGLHARWWEDKEPVEELLYGGAAGGGKSYLLRCVGFTLCYMWPGAVVALFRRTYPELEESHIRWAQQEVPSQLATYNTGRRELRFKNGSILEFRHADEEKAVFAYNTAEWAGLLVDQAEAFTEFQLRFLRSRVRQRKGAFSALWRPIIVYSANPGGISHVYLRDGFVDQAPPETPFQAPTEDGGLRRCFLPARLSDNPSLDGDDYRRRLQGLPDHLVRQYLEGDWAGVIGSYFAQWRAYDGNGGPWHVWPEAFARRHYNVKDDEPFPPKHWLRWCGVDGGFHDPWCVLWLARAPDRRVFVYKEQYDVGVQIDEQAKRIAAAIWEELELLYANEIARLRELRELHCEENERIKKQYPEASRQARSHAYDELIDIEKEITELEGWKSKSIREGVGLPHMIVCDPSMMRLRANYRMLGITVTDAMIYGQLGIRLTPGTNQRIPGWRRISEALSRTLDDGYPALAVLEGQAPHLVRTLPYLLMDNFDRDDVSDEHGKADPRSPSSIRDDACLAAGTLIATTRGDVPIELVCPGDFVLLPGNQVRKVVRSEKVGIKGAWRYKFSDGRTLIATPDHRIHLRGGRFERIDALGYNDTIDAWDSPDSLLSRSHIEASSFAATQTLHVGPTGSTLRQAVTGASAASNTYTRRFGKIPAALSPKGITSTIRILTQPITIPATLSASRARRTPSAIPAVVQAFRSRPEPLPPYGTNPTLGVFGILSTPGSSGLSGSPENISVNTVVAPTGRGIEQFIASALLGASRPIEESTNSIMSYGYAQSAVSNSPGTFTPVARRARESVRGLSDVPKPVKSKYVGEIAVYDLAVEGHVYYANGIPVHNCDALRMALMPATAPVYSSQRIEIVSRHTPDQSTSLEVLGPSDGLNQSGIESSW